MRCRTNKLLQKQFALV